ncbi:efflux transporter outer membrane subunit [Cereibacter changlensis]|nr:efflux transporter outer membrane subunit [Cereibacter changlensis]PZX47726.1 NodT family efflux transporter outer membrane factor (OMF) lipoprotein [Cereibacter changlensis]
MRSLIGLGAALVLSACSATTIQPVAKQPVSVRFAAGVPQAGDAIDVGWWSQLDDAELNELLRLANQSSPSLRTAAASVMRARAAAGQSAADLFPDLTGGADSSVAGGQNSARRTTNAASLDASWELDLFGRARQSAAASRLSAAAEDAAFSGAFISLSSEVADTYVQYRACRLVEAIYRQAIASQAETIKATGELAAAGFSPSSDRSLANANAASAAISLETQRADCRVLAQTLAVSVGAPQGRIDSILATGGGLPSPKAFRITSAPVEALRQRPDVAEAELDFASAMATMGAAKADLYPSLSLSGSVTVSDPTSWSFGPAISLPIFDGGERRASVRVANAEAITAAEAYRTTVLTAVSEVEGALTRLNAARASGASARTAVAGYREYFGAVDEIWQAGGETLLNREEARRTLQSAQITEVQQREAEVRQWIALYKAAGGGWKRAGVAG